VHLTVDFDVGDEVVVGGAGLFQRRLGLIDREAERHRVDLEQHVTVVDVLAFLDHDLVDLAGNIRSDQHLLRADIGVVGADIASAVEIEHQSADHGHDRQHDQKQKAAIAAQAAIKLRRGATAASRAGLSGRAGI